MVCAREAMRFNSLVYFSFLGAVLAVLAAIPTAWRRGWLLIASAAFYASVAPALPRGPRGCRGRQSPGREVDRRCDRPKAPPGSVMVAANLDVAPVRLQVPGLAREANVM